MTLGDHTSLRTTSGILLCSPPLFGLFEAALRHGNERWHVEDTDFIQMQGFLYIMFKMLADMFFLCTPKCKMYV